jgi:lysophospholipase L1-like esterase
MQAKNGFAVSIRKRGRLALCAVAMVALTAMLFAPTAGAQKAAEPTQYLALGDSLAFGYTDAKFKENFPPCLKAEPTCEPPSAFEEGYADFFFKKAQKASNKFATELRGLKLINNGCPGETTDSMIGDNPLGKALDGAEAESPCGYHKKGFRLHHEYGEVAPGVGRSQLESALKVIAEGSAKGEPTRAVTLNIGANDELRALHKCEKEVQEEYEKTGKSKYGGENPKESVINCIGTHTKEVIEHIVKNTGTIIFVLDEGSKFGGVNYTGNIILQGFYNPQTFVLPGSDKIQEALNKALQENLAGEGGANPKGKFPNVTFANPFPYFNPQNNGEGTPKEEARICLLTEMCKETGKADNPKGDIHPTKLGYEKLAAFVFKAFNPAL